MKKAVWGCLLAALCALPPAAGAQAGDAVRIVVSFPPGGPVDTVARIVAQQLSREIDRNVIVENKPGANGAIGADAVVRSRPDGNTLWLTSVGAAAVNPALYPKLSYDPQRDLAPVSGVVNNVEVLVVNARNPAKTAPEFVAQSKTRPDGLAMGSSGIGSIPHLAIEQFGDATGARLLHVPYSGAAPAITGLIGSQIDGFFGDVTGLVSYIASGRLRPLGVASPRRNPALPDVPTLAEQGIVGVDTNNWYALFAPARTPPETIAALNRAVHAALQNPMVAKRLLQTGAEPAPSTPEQLAQLLRQDSGKWSRLIRAKDIKPQ